MEGDVQAAGPAPLQRAPQADGGGFVAIRTWYGTIEIPTVGGDVEDAAGRTWRRWVFYLRGPDFEDLGHAIERVRLKLHESFEGSEGGRIRCRDSPPFVFEDRAWGEFVLQAEILWRNPLGNGEGTSLLRCKLQRGAGTQPVVSEKHASFVFPDPTRSLRDRLRWAPRRPLEYDLEAALDEEGGDRSPAVTIRAVVEKFGTSPDGAFELRRLRALREALTAQADKLKEDEAMADILLCFETPRRTAATAQIEETRKAPSPPRPAAKAKKGRRGVPRGAASMKGAEGVEEKENRATRRRLERARELNSRSLVNESTLCGGHLRMQIAMIDVKEHVGPYIPPPLREPTPPPTPTPIYPPPTPTPTPTPPVRAPTPPSREEPEPPDLPPESDLGTTDEGGGIDEGEVEPDDPSDTEEAPLSERSDSRGRASSSLFAPMELGHSEMGIPSLSDD